MKHSRSTLAGVVLLVFGALLLIDRLTGISLFSTLFLLAVGLGLIATGVVNRMPGLTIPGGIVAGVGLGVFAVQLAAVPAVGRGGLFLVCLALGWLSIVPASRAAGEAQTWAYIPAFILGLIGAALLASASVPRIINVVVRWWPLALIIVGAMALRPRKGG